MSRVRVGERDLRDVTFVILDLETTGMTPDRAAITEIGAVRYRGGERLATLQTLVDPSVSVPRVVSSLTGITDELLVDAPALSSVLPALHDFVEGVVVVGHNVNFDRAFLDHALTAEDYPPLPSPALDTLGLARTLLGDEVARHRLSWVAAYLRTEHRPTHRALDDALATADVFHALLGRVATYGVTTLEQLVAFPGAVPGTKGRGQEPPRLSAAGRP